MLAVFAAYEKALIGERTARGLAEKKAAGVVLGRPRTLPDAIRDRIKAERAENTTWQLIADRLTIDGIATAQGGRWQAGAVRKIGLAEC
jgi:DNA invertase Pin-like site-specific DNA recombinase